MFHSTSKSAFTDLKSILTIDNHERLVVYGGPQSGNSVEVYNPYSQTWQNTNIELKNSTYAFGFLSTKLINVQMFQ